MRNCILVMIILICCISSSCLTIKKRDLDPRRLGRISTVVYLAAKENNDSKYISTVEIVYKNFDKMLSSDLRNDVNVKKWLIEKLKKNIGSDKKVTIMIAVEIVDMYWDKLNDKFAIADSPLNNQLYILRQFNAGVKDALGDYKYLQ